MPVERGERRRRSDASDAEREQRVPDPRTAVQNPARDAAQVRIGLGDRDEADGAERFQGGCDRVQEGTEEDAESDGSENLWGLEIHVRGDSLVANHRDPRESCGGGS